MKKINIPSQILRFGLFSVLTISSLGVFSACKDREEDPNENVNVQFRVSTVDNAKINTTVTQVGTVQNHKFFSPPGDSWNSDNMIVNTKEGAVYVTANGVGPSATSKLIVSIWINGEKKATDTAKGVNLLAKTSVNFNK